MKHRMGKVALVGIGAAGILAFSTANALASTVSPASVWTTNGCNVGIEYVSNTQAYAYADSSADSYTCNYSFQVRYEPGGGTAVLVAGTVSEANGYLWNSAEDYTHNSVTELRICANSNGSATVCTTWGY